MNLNKEQRFNLLVSAVEGGSNYWYELLEDASDLVNKYDGDTFCDRCFAALTKGESIPVHDIETGELLGELNMRTIKHGELLMQREHPYHWADIISDNDDATTADVWFQLAVMKEVIYG